MEFTSIDGVSVRPDGVALLTSPFSPPGAKSGATPDGGVGGQVRPMYHSGLVMTPCYDGGSVPFFGENISD